MMKAPSLAALKAEARLHGGVIEHAERAALKFRLNGNIPVWVFYGFEQELAYPEARRCMMGALKALGGGR